MERHHRAQLLLAGEPHDDAVDAGAMAAAPLHTMSVRSALVPGIMFWSGRIERAIVPSAS
jgi:hypothetical protein